VTDRGDPIDVADPRLSFVLVAHQEQAFLGPCVQSILADPSGEIELVVVDNASTDHVPELLDELAATDERLTIHRLDPAQPQGTARALGVAASRGDYVWFVDTPDELEPGAAARALELLGRRDLDVLVIDHTIVGPLVAFPAPTSRIVQGLAGKRAVDVRKRPDLLDLAQATWGLVMRRRLLDDWGVSPDGHHLEVAVGYNALLAASTIGALPGFGYRRRQAGTTRRVAAVHGRDTDLVEEFETVFAFLDAHRPQLDDRRPVVPGRMVRAGTQRLHRLPGGQRGAYARRLVDTVGPRAAASDPIPPGRLTKVRMMLVRRRQAALYRLLEWWVHSVRSARSLAGRGAGVGQRFLRKAVRAVKMLEYAVHRRLPLRDDVAVFASYWYRGYACNPRAIYEAMRDLAPHLRGVWVIRPGTTVPPGVETVIADSREYFRLIARAKYFVNNVNFPDHMRKRSGMVHVQTHHGTPLKRMGLDLRDAAGAGQRTNFRALIRRCSAWDFSVSANRLSTLVWERVYPVNFTSLEYGYPRNDVLATATDADVAAARESLDIEDGKKVLLYAPTHREYERGFRSLLDTIRLAESLGDDWIVLSRAHYFYDVGQPVAAMAHGRVIDVTSHDSVEQLCLAADVLITDYSSVMFDYAVLDRPLVIYAPDWETYRSLRGTYFDLIAEPPGVVCRTPEDVVDAIVSGAYKGDVADKARRVFRSKYCAWDDGHAAERVVRRVFLGETPPSPRRRPAA
jgi:CDP-glycerol glycerophosphotransferase